MKDAAARLPKELVRDITTKPLDSVKNAAFSQYGKNGASGGSLSEDASDRLESGMERTADYGSRAVWNGGKKTAQTAVQKYKKAVADRKQRKATQTAAEENGCNSAESFPAPEHISSEPSSATGAATEPESVLIREKQESGMRIKTKEADQVQKTMKSAGRVKDTGKGLRSSAERVKSVKRAERIGKGATAATKKTGKVYQAGKQLAIRGRQTAMKTGKGAKQVFRGVKAVVKTAVTAVRSIAALISGGVVVVLLVIILGVVGGIAGSSGNSSPEPLSQEVLAYTSLIQKYASQYGIPDYVASIQAIMMQESGGRGTDPMQSSECPYNTKYANSPGAIQDPEYSIQVGIQYYADCVEQAGCESPADMGRLQLSWQGYNYGNGYIGWALANYGGYSLENALEFSRQQAASHGWSGYGDPEYVPHVQRYYSGGNIFAGLFGNQQIVNVALGEIGQSNGEKYWSWYGFSSYQEWCACFVSWCGEQSGLIESGTMPKFSLCSDGMSWFQSHGKWQSAGSTPSAGSLVFFDWGGDGVPDHVAIVEKCEGDIVYTVEGNTSTTVSGNSVRGVWQHQYPIGSGNILGFGRLKV